MARPKADLRSLARSAVEREELDVERLAEILEIVENVAASPLWARSLAASQRFVEIPFEMVREGEGDDVMPTLIRGVIDLVFREPHGWVIVDYKTDPRADSQLDHLVQRHRPQLQEYARAWEKMTGEPVIEQGLFFTAVGRYEKL
jgi:ATP-dependent helicase/nuclease subunit A